MTTMAPLPEIEAPSWSVRQEQPIDVDQIHELHRASFHGPAEAELVDAIRSGPHFVPELSLVAVTDDGSVLGHILVSRIGLDPADESPRRDVLALAPLAVLPPHRGRGIGSALVRSALAAADAREEPCVIVLGSPAYYGRFGFEPAARYGITGPYDAAGEAFQVRRRQDLDRLEPGTAVYPPTFARV